MKKRVHRITPIKNKGKKHPFKSKVKWEKII